MLRYSGLSGSVVTDDVTPRSAASAGAFTYVTSESPQPSNAPLSALIARIDESCSEISPLTVKSMLTGASPAIAVAICAIFSTNGKLGRISS